MTGKMDEEWRHICFWLWAIGMFSKKKNAKPPILLLGTKAGEPRKLDELELQKRLVDLQGKVPWLKEQLQLHPNGLRNRNCFWLFPIENKGINSENFIRPLRRHLQHMVLQFVTPRDSSEADDDAVPGLGMQAKLYPLAWLQAHDLLTRLGSGFRLFGTLFCCVEEVELWNLWSGKVVERFKKCDSETIRFRNYHDSETIAIQKLSSFRN